MNQHPPDSVPFVPDDQPLPAGWVLADRFDGPNVTVLLFRRDGSRSHWVTASGTTFADALASGRLRMQMYDSNER
jgi:hypothetical protein